MRIVSSLALIAEGYGSLEYMSSALFSKHPVDHDLVDIHVI